MMKPVSLFFLIVGFGLWIGAFNAFATYRDQKNNMEMAKATVVSFKTETVRANEQNIKKYFFPVVEFTPKNGKPVTEALSEGRQIMDFFTGDKMEVTYPKDNPKKIREVSVWDGIIATVIWSLFAVFSWAIAWSWSKWDEAAAEG